MKYDVYYMDPYQPQIEAKQLPREFYKKVATVELEDVEDVFEQMNHIDGNTLVSKMYPQLRSMSVGDIIVDETGDACMVHSNGFAQIEFNP